MKTSLHIFIFFLFIALNVVEVFAQYPQHFTYDDENGLPSNEVYSIIQDQKGFIWIGCDAGLFKFDGIRYTSYQCQTQKSNPITGLTLSQSGRLYCYNFKSQIFYLENATSSGSGQTLKEITHNFQKINGIQPDNKGKIVVSHNKGLACYDEITKKWTNFSDYKTKDDHYTSSPVLLKNNAEIRFISPSGIGIVKQSKFQLIPFDKFIPVGNCVMTSNGQETFIFSKYQNIIFKEKNKVISEVKSTALNQILQNRKVTNAVFLSDGKLWICTYKGIVEYDINTDKAKLYYPDLSFSDAIIDREGNYWFSTLQSGLMRIFNLNYIVWNKENKLLENNKISKLATDKTNVFFASVNGTIGKLNTSTNELQTFHTGIDADIQSFNYDETDQQLYFNINNHLFALQNNLLSKKPNDISAIKALKKINDTYFTASSFGTFINSEKINESWSRQIVYDKQLQTVWVASNEGLLKIVYENKKWILKETILPDVQILSIDFDEHTKELYALAYDGHFGKLSAHSQFTHLAHLPKNIQANKINYYDHKIYVASNKGIWIFDLHEEKNGGNGGGNGSRAVACNGSTTITTINGLTSNNVQDLVILGNNIWIATGKGLQKIPLNSFSEKPLAKIYLKNCQLTSLRTSPLVNNNYQLKYGEVLILNPEVAHYTSNGNFEFAYRINNNAASRSQSDGWIKLPATIEQIEIQNLPAGKFEIELKAIDYLGRDSENTITVSGYVKPPFWQTWWFVLIIALSFVAFVIWIAHKIITGVRKRANDRTRLIQSQLTALKAQMNPHFIFNVLTSIKNYIYKNDKEKASDYLDSYSDFMRSVLEMSSVQYTTIHDELKTIRLYIELEALMLDDFSFQLHCDDSAYSMKIPAMILQPYIENAFKHGLSNKKGERKLDIKIVAVTNETVKIEITDNGIGRKASGKLNKQNTLKSNSFATSAIENRIALINSEEQLHIEAEIIDLYEQSAQGTRVILTIRNKK